MHYSAETHRVVNFAATYMQGNPFTCNEFDSLRHPLNTVIQVSYMPAIKLLFLQGPMTGKKLMFNCTTLQSSHPTITSQGLGGTQNSNTASKEEVNRSHQFLLASEEADGLV